MEGIPKEQVAKRIEAENPWWVAPFRINDTYYKLRRRPYFRLLMPLVIERTVKRAVLLMGPRRVGKTVLLHHGIQSLIDEGVNPRRICYLSVDHPIYNGCSLQELLDLCAKASGIKLDPGPAYVFFDEIQYLKDWEVHLKSLVDSQPDIKFVASGSAAAALRLRSQESGAGRFTDFLLPPLTFHEYLELLGETDLIVMEEAQGFFQGVDIQRLNKRFLHYLNFGGYPEVVFSDVIQSDPARFIKADIIDKVLLRDLPSLYGIQDIQELNYLFTTLAYNTANEISLEQLSQSSGVAKNTIKRYIEYLEAAFLVKVVHRIDRNAKRFQRANFFKVYLTNPSIRSALFTPMEETDRSMGALTETGILSQLFHMNSPLYYARWNHGEVDIVALNERQKPRWAVEVKWTDRPVESPRTELRSLISFCLTNNLSAVTVTSRTLSEAATVEGISIRFVPASIYCFTVGYNIIQSHKLPSQRSKEE